MPIKPPTFTAANIIAILEAAPHGGTIQDVVTRSRANVSEATVKNWLKRGQQARNDDQNTSHRLFIDQWDKLYPGAPARNEMSRMLEMQKALETMGIKINDSKEATNGKTDNCDCGNSKPKNENACSDCTAIDSRPRAT